MFYRVGVVHEVELKTGRARVRLPGHDDMITWWLEVLTIRAHKDRVFWMPEKGEHVAVMLDERMEAGCILGAVYGGCHPTPDGATASTDKAVMVADDGARFEYDRAAHKLSVTLPAGAIVAIVSDGGVTWNASGGMEITGDVSVTGNITATKDISDKNGSMQEMRDAYNSHSGHSAGGPPSPQMT